MHVKQTGAVDKNGVPTGRDSARFTGTVHRLSQDQLHIDDATFTLCDCGEDVPSWLITAESADAEMKERVTIHWPTFWANPFGLGFLVPLLPPIPFISLPLEGRAAGQLAPVIQFYQFPYPLVDLPVFVPLGRSFDLTIIPGLRTDWTDKHALTPPSRWGAPRLGGRLRYAPVEGT